MMRPFLLGLAAILALAAPLHAKPPRVVVDIPALHGIAAALLEGLGEPDLLLSGPASPHDFQLRPSDAQALARAEVILWVGAALAPQIAAPIERLGARARRITLLELPGVHLLPFREGPLFDAARAPDDGEGHADEESEDGHGAHDHGTVDPHAWLDPDNARRLAVALRDALSEADPDNAAAYERNHGRFLARLAAAEAKARATLARHPRQPFLLMHDSTQYFEAAFEVMAAGAVSDGDATRPGAARLARLRQAIAERGIRCLLVEPGPVPPVVAMFEGLEIVETDPLGQTLPPGPDLYPRLIETLAAAFARCP